jgi:hypothetical protein
LATLLRPDEGHVRVAGFDPVTDPVTVRARIGWMPDVFGVYDQLTVREYLAFFADAYLLAWARAGERLATLLAQVHLEEYAGRYRCCRGVRSSGWHWPGRSCTSRGCSCSTSRHRAWHVARGPPGVPDAAAHRPVAVGAHRLGVRDRGFTGLLQAALAVTDDEPGVPLFGDLMLFVLALVLIVTRVWLCG